MTQPKTINLTPSWEALLPSMLAIVTDGDSHEARAFARSELRRMATLADAWVQHCKTATPTTHDDKETTQ